MTTPLPLRISGANGAIRGTLRRSETTGAAAPTCAVKVGVENPGGMVVMNAWRRNLANQATAFVDGLSTQGEKIPGFAEVLSVSDEEHATGFEHPMDSL